MLVPSKRKRVDDQPMSYANELQILKDKLTCPTHVGENKWCWVDPHVPDAAHIPLCLHDLQLWLQYFWKTQHASAANIACLVLPPTEHFVELRKNKKPTRALSRTPTDPAIQVDHPAASANATRMHIPSTSKAPNGRGITRQYALFLEFDSDSDESQHRRKRVKNVRVAGDVGSDESIGDQHKGKNALAAGNEENMEPAQVIG